MKFCSHKIRGPRTIVGRTILVLLAGLVVSHLISIAIYSDDRRTAVHSAGGRHVSERIAAAYLSMDQANILERQAVVRSLWEPMFSLTWTKKSVLSEVNEGGWRAHMVRSTIKEYLSGIDASKIRIAYYNVDQFMPGMTPGTGGNTGTPSIAMQRYMGAMMDDQSDHVRRRFNRFSRKWRGDSVLSVSMQLTDGTWINVATPGTQLRSSWWPRVFTPIAVTSIIILFLSVWAVRRSSRPIALFAQAAERLGRDVNAPPLPEDGPREVVSASRAFNDMQRKLQSFIKDRTHMLAAISHDLRTPITRLRLRAELIEDTEQQQKMLADLDQMEQMISATLTFARDESAHEVSVRFDLAAMLQSLADGISDTNSQASYTGPDKLEWSGRPVALMRAFQNLADNAIKYGQCADISLAEEDQDLVVTVLDNGSGIPEKERTKVFEPFYRMEPSRNRDTGGVGLGLAVTRSVVRAHGGDVYFTDVDGRFALQVKLPKS